MNKPSYYKNELITNRDQFLIYFKALDEKCKCDLLMDIFCENDKYLDMIFLVDKGVTGFDSSFLFLQSLPSEQILSNQNLIEFTFKKIIEDSNENKKLKAIVTG